MIPQQQWTSLKRLLSELQPAVIAYSGGVDSSLLLKAAADVMGSNVLAVIGDSETYPGTELSEAVEFARSLGVAYRVLHTEELSHDEFAANPPDRCYYCKKELFGKLAQIARTEGFRSVLDGSNLDDLSDHRPGSRAAAEFGVRSPLREAGFTKDDVRGCARTLGLPQWDKPSLACLSSRIPYGTRITTNLLKTVQAAEDILHVLGFRQVRVRHHGETARIEIPRSEFSRFLAEDTACSILVHLKQLGYTYVCLDVEGYRTGSMNETLAMARSVQKADCPPS